MQKVHAPAFQQALLAKNRAFTSHRTAPQRQSFVPVRAEAMDGLKQVANGVGHALNKGVEKANESVSGQVRCKECSSLQRVTFQRMKGLLSAVL
jgi:hypothetical protein